MSVQIKNELIQALKNLGTVYFPQSFVDAMVKLIDVSVSDGGGSDIVVQDNLTTASATDALSANQGVALKGLIDAIPANPTGANPTGSVGTTAVNGVASTFMRSDAAPAINQAIAPVWTGAHTFTAAGTTLVPGFGIKNATPLIDIWNTAVASADQRRWGQQVLGTGGTFVLRAYNDDGTTGNGGIGIQIFRNGATVLDLQLWANASMKMKIESTKISTTVPTILTSGYTVAGLPAAAASLKGARAFVTDASVANPAFMSTPTGGGAETVPVFCTGTAWVYG